MRRRTFLMWPLAVSACASTRAEVARTAADPTTSTPEPARGPDVLAADFDPSSLAPRTSSDAATVYACPMHPEVRSNEPGKCPKCGMALEPVPAPKHDHGGHEGHE